MRLRPSVSLGHSDVSVGDADVWVRGPGGLGQGPGHLGQGPGGLGQGAENLGRGPSRLGRCPGTSGSGTRTSVSASTICAADTENDVTWTSVSTARAADLVTVSARRSLMSAKSKALSTWGALLLMVTFAACSARNLDGPGAGNDVLDFTSTNDIATIDFASSADGSSLPPAGNQSCPSILICALGCASASCLSACTATGTDQAQAFFQAIIACGYDGCIVALDGGAPGCMSTADDSPGCLSCLDQTASSVVCATPISNCENN